MNIGVNKKLDRLKQWAGEKMGGEAKTSVSDEFKALEMEMDLRYEGADLRGKGYLTGADDCQEWFRTRSQ